MVVDCTKRYHAYLNVSISNRFNHFTSSFNLLDRKQKLNNKTKSHIVAEHMHEMSSVCVYDNDMLTIFMDDGILQSGFAWKCIAD